MHAKRLAWAVCVTSLVLIAQASFLSERGHQTETQTEKERDTDRRVHSNYIHNKHYQYFKQMINVQYTVQI